MDNEIRGPDDSVHRLQKWVWVLPPEETRWRLVGAAISDCAAEHMAKFWDGYSEITDAGVRP